ncbi:hypothetical protein [Capnocytophaga granulosa]
METQEKNVSLAGYNHTKTETMETVTNVFTKKDNHSYTICFLGGRDESIFRNRKYNISKRDIELLAKEIYEVFKKSSEIKILKIITSGTGGISGTVVKKFEKYSDKRDLREKGKEIQLIAVITTEEKKTPIGYDYVIRTDNVTEQMEAMMNLSNLFIGLPGSTSTNIATVVETISKKDSKENFIVLLHSYWYSVPFWKGELPVEKIKTLNKAFLFNQISPKQYSSATSKTASLEALKEDILDCLYINVPKKERDIEYDVPILAIDFNYVIEEEKEVKIFSISYETESYINTSLEYFNYLNDSKYKENTHFAREEEVYAVTILPNGKHRRLEHLHYYPEKTHTSVSEYRLERLKDESHLTGKDDIFKTFARFLDKKQYGQTLLWRCKSFGAGLNKLRFSIFILFNQQLPETKINVIKLHVEDFLSQFSSSKVAEVIREKNRNLEKSKEIAEEQARKAAYAQVFIRNLSHNIISHVLVHLQKGEEFSFDKLKKHIQKSNTYQSSFLLPWEKEQREITPIEQQEQLAIFFRYISNRCFYLNEAVYGITNTVAEKRVYGELFKQLDENRILLNYISGIDNFKYQIHFIKETEKGYEIFNEKNDISIMLPGGTIGEQAFYNIIENIIRNTAKHNVIGMQDCVHFVVKFSNSKSLKKYYEVEIFDSIAQKESYRLIDRLNRMLLKSAFNMNNNQLRSYGLGQLEMKAAGAFLQQEDIAKIGEFSEKTLKEYKKIGKNVVEIFQEHNLTFLHAFTTNQVYDEALQNLRETENRYLGYRFYVRKPEKYVFVFKEDYFLEEKNKKALESYGISFLAVEEFKNSIREGQVYSHEFIFLQEGAQDKLGELGECFYKTHNDKQTNRKERVEALSLLPERLMLIEKDFAKKLIDSKDIEDFEKEVWEQWEGEKVEEINKNTTKVNQDIYRDNIGETGNGFNYDECRQVVFFDHLNNYDTWKNLTAGVNTSLVTIEPLSSAAQRKLPEFKNNLNEYIRVARKSPICQKLVEAYFNKVIVIDERIQRAAESIYPAKDGQGVKEAEIFNYINVLIPEKEKIDLAKEHFSNDDKNAIIAYIDNIKKAEFLVIHYGILERIYNNDTNRTEAINKQLNKWVRTTRVIVTSGRGRQTLEHLPLSVNYLNISSLLYAFVENRNKYSINYILNQSRR